jgi:hypothetical protein
MSYWTVMVSLTHGPSMPVMQAFKVPTPGGSPAKFACQLPVPATVTDEAPMPFQVTDTEELAGLTIPAAVKPAPTVALGPGEVMEMDGCDMAFSLNETYLSICSITIDRNDALDR